MEAGRRRGELTPDERDQMTNAEALALIDRIEEQIAVVRLYVADSLLHPEGHDGDSKR